MVRDRFRNWSFVVYPESAPQDWCDILDDLHIQWVKSPLHDKDVDANGEVKKDHWHVLVMFDSVKTFDQIKEITDKLNAPIPQKAQSVKGLVRYMAHLDDPDKHQYPVSQIIARGGVDISELLKPSAGERDDIIAEMCDWVDDNEIVHFKELARYARHNRRDDWHAMLTRNSTMYMVEYIKSNWQMCNEMVRKNMDEYREELFEARQSLREERRGLSEWQQVLNERDRAGGAS